MNDAASVRDGEERWEGMREMAGSDLDLRRSLSYQEDRNRNFWGNYFPSLLHTPLYLVSITAKSQLKPMGDIYFIITISS